MRFERALAYSGGRPNTQYRRKQIFTACNTLYVIYRGLELNRNAALLALEMKCSACVDYQITFVRAYVCEYRSKTVKDKITERHKDTNLKNTS